MISLFKYNQMNTIKKSKLLQVSTLKNTIQSQGVLSNCIRRLCIHKTQPTQYSKYNDVQQRVILDKLNNSTEEELAKLSLSKARAKKITEFRSQFGQFESIDRALNVQGLRIVTLEKFCEAVILGKDSLFSKKTSKHIASIINPAISAEKIKTIKNVVGLQINSNLSFSWAEVSRSFELMGWKCIDQADAYKKHTPSSLYDLVNEVFLRLPDADFYILDTPPSMLQQQSSPIPPSFMKRFEAQAMVLALLNSRQPRQHRTIFLKYRLAARLYGIQVGSERVLSLPVVERLMNGEGVGPEDCSCLAVYNPELTSFFKACSGPQQEGMGYSLLLAMSFLKLLVHNDEICLKAMRLI